MKIQPAGMKPTLVHEAEETHSPSHQLSTERQEEGEKKQTRLEKHPDCADISQAAHFPTYCEDTQNKLLRAPVGGAVVPASCLLLMEVVEFH